MVEAKLCGSNTKEKRSISYNFADSIHSLCLEEREIIQAQIQACEKLLKNTKDDVEDLVIKTEIIDLILVLAAIKSNKNNSKLAYCSSYGCKNKGLSYALPALISTLAHTNTPVYIHIPPMNSKF